MKRQGLALLLMVLLPFTAPARGDSNTAPPGGAERWAQYCGDCHGLRPPEDFGDQQWRVVMQHMRVRAGLTGEETQDILRFLQEANNLQPFAGGVAPATTPRSDISRGQTIYQQTCSACHGADGRGSVPGAPDFSAAEGVLTKPDEVLIDNIINGVSTPGAPSAMPPKGGNPNLTRSDIEAVVGYMREAFLQ